MWSKSHDELMEKVAAGFAGMGDGLRQAGFSAGKKRPKISPKLIAAGGLAAAGVGGYYLNKNRKKK